MKIGILKQLKTLVGVVTFNKAINHTRTGHIVQPYGLDAIPPIDSRVVCATENNKEAGLITGIVNQNSQANLGETTVYNNFGSNIKLLSDGSVKINDNVNIDIDGNITVTGNITANNKCTIETSGAVNITGNVTITGNLTVTGVVSGATVAASSGLSAGKALTVGGVNYKTHTHPAGALTTTVTQLNTPAPVMGNTGSVS